MIIHRSVGWEALKPRPKEELGHNVKNHGADGLLIWSYQRLEEPAVATATSAPASEKLHLGLCAHTAPSGTASLIGISDG